MEGKGISYPIKTNFASLQVLRDNFLPVWFSAKGSQPFICSPLGSSWTCIQCTLFLPAELTQLSPIFSAGLFPFVKHFNRIRKFWKREAKSSPYPLCSYMLEAATATSLMFPANLIWKSTSTQHTQDHRISEHPKIEGTHKDHQVQLQAPHSTNQNSNPISESSVQTLPELWQPDAITTALGNLSQCLTTL